jgi:hypothetical protein
MTLRADEDIGSHDPDLNKVAPSCEAGQGQASSNLNMSPQIVENPDSTFAREPDADDLG